MMLMIMNKRRENRMKWTGTEESQANDAMRVRSFLCALNTPKRIRRDTACHSRRRACVHVGVHLSPSTSRSRSLPLLSLRSCSTSFSWYSGDTGGSGCWCAAGDGEYKESLAEVESTVTVAVVSSAIEVDDHRLRSFERLRVLCVGGVEANFVLVDFKICETPFDFLCSFFSFSTKASCSNSSYSSKTVSSESKVVEWGGELWWMSGCG